MGVAFPAICMIGISDKEEAMNKFTPMVGVTKPMARLTAIITPK